MTNEERLAVFLRHVGGPCIAWGMYVDSGVFERDPFMWVGRAHGVMECDDAFGEGLYPTLARLLDLTEGQVSTLRDMYANIADSPTTRFHGYSRETVARTPWMGEMVALATMMWERLGHLHWSVARPDRYDRRVTL